MDSTDVAIINITVGAGQANWEKAFLAAAARSEIFGVNECLTQKQRETYRRLAKKAGLSHYGTGTPNPIFWDRSKYGFVRANTYKLHGAGPNRRYPGFNAERYATVVILEHIETGEEITIICTHWVPRGKKVPEWWRRLAREKSRVKIANIARNHMKDRRKVILIGDLNVAGAYEIITRAKYIVSSGVDKIVVFPERKVKKAKVQRFDAPVDHGGGVSATVWWT